MRWFGRQPAPVGAPDMAVGAIGNVFDPVALLAALDVTTPDYLGRADRGDLIYPACTRTLTDKAGDVRSIWEHTRIEAMRYGARCNRMLTERQYPPLVVYMIWFEYTRLAKEVASAAIYGSSIDKAETRDREHFTRKLASRPAELASTLGALADAMGRLRTAHEPDDLLPK